MGEKLVIRNIGTLLSGDIVKPILEADTIVAVDGRIVEVGKASAVDTSGADKTVDARGTTVAPGLSDSHAQPAYGRSEERRGGKECVMTSTFRWLTSP